VATAHVAFDLVDVGNGAAVTTGELGALFSVNSNATTARVEGDHRVKTLGSCLAGDGARYESRATGFSATNARETRRSTGANDRTRLGSGTRRTIKTIDAVRKSIFRALAAGLVARCRDPTRFAGVAHGGAFAGDGSGRAIDTLVGDLESAFGTVLAAGAIVNLARGAHVDTLDDASRTGRASEAERADITRGSAGRRPGTRRALGARQSTGLRVVTSGTSRALRTAPVLAGTARRGTRGSAGSGMSAGGTSGAAGGSA
jgi:hypothetical protein